jgi:hypothetical protein
VTLSVGPVRRWLWVGGIASVALIAFVLVWFQPQKLFIDERVDEPLPVVTAGDPAPAAEAPAPDPPAEAAAPVATPAELARGAFMSRDHSTTGVARVLDVGGGRRVVRLEGLDTSNGPDLYLYLSANPAGGPEGAFDDDYVSLGRLKGNQGDQNYDLPVGTDLARVPTVVIWCDRFDSAFGAVELTIA